MAQLYRCINSSDILGKNRLNKRKLLELVDCFTLSSLEYVMDQNRFFFFFANLSVLKSPESEKVFFGMTVFEVLYTSSVVCEVLYSLNVETDFQIWFWGIVWLYQDFFIFSKTLNFGVATIRKQKQKTKFFSILELTIFMKFCWSTVSKGQNNNYWSPSLHKLVINGKHFKISVIGIYIYKIRNFSKSALLIQILVTWEVNESFNF